ncbi:hypothetical protein [Streptomyces sp. NPDC004232]|uniref:hypothetical protein n=1 Tax=unclassified Streptomyces TaxID=2593676 RepID=UPI0033AEAAD0
MISSRRIVAALGLAAGITGLAVPTANAAPTGAPHKALLNPMTTLDAIAVSDIPAAHRKEVPKVSEQMRALNRVDQLNKLDALHQVTDLAGP